MPVYFAHDYVQRTMRLTAFSRSWPSLFVAARGTRSSLHVDQWSGHFFMAQVRGVKRWTIFHRSSTPHLRPSWSRGTLDPAMPPLEEQEAMGMSPRAMRWDVDLAPGEVLFVPGGAAHAVSNLDATVAFAGNFIDDTNLDRALVDLRLMGRKRGEQMMQSFYAARRGGIRRPRLRDDLPTTTTTTTTRSIRRVASCARRSTSPGAVSTSSERAVPNAARGAASRVVEEIERPELERPWDANRRPMSMNMPRTRHTRVSRHPHRHDSRP